VKTLQLKQTSIFCVYFIDLGPTLQNSVSLLTVFS
jgi:hypothetical protein